jgi:serine protease Do
MDDIQILDAVERYIRGEMSPEERTHFETLRTTNAEIDQLVVEHTLSLQRMEEFGERQSVKSTLHEVHANLAEKGEINDNARLEGRAKIVYLWTRYKRVAAIAACIAGVTAITISGLVWSISPKPPSAADYKELSREVTETKKKTNKLEKDLDVVKDGLEVAKDNTPKKPAIAFKTIGTAFFIDAKGLMITNAHVVKNSRNINVFNSKGEKFNAIVVKLDVAKDMAFIKIDDDHFKPFASLPYGIRKAGSDIAEPIFTLGFPRDEIVYGEGYLSARTGFKGDTLSCQIAVAANPGNSGGPIFNSEGEVIGVLSAKQMQADDAVFAVQSKYIYQALEELKKNSLYRNMKMSSKSAIARYDRKQQVKKIQDYVFMVKGD